MKILQLTPGAAGMYCGGCMRDNALVAALRRAGHDALLLPLYTPLKTDEPDNSTNRIFFGGVNVFLQQKSSLFRSTPTWLEKPLDSAALLNFATSFGITTSPQELGELTVSMLKGEDGNQAKEIEKLLAWLKTQPRFDVICLSNVLLAGMVESLRRELKISIACTLQGEDYFVDGLPEKFRDSAWGLLRKDARNIDAFIPVSRYFGQVMQQRLQVDASKVHPIHNGIELQDYGPAAAAPAMPAIGYLARLAPEKGLRTLVSAFEKICARGKVANVRLKIAGSMTAMDKPFATEIEDSLRKSGLIERVDFHYNVDRNEKIRFLQSLSVFSVPATYGEAFGLYVLEALACGVPVVQPRHGAFPEILEKTGGGILYEPGGADDLAQRLEELLLNREEARALGESGRRMVLEHFGIDRVAKEVAALFTGLKV